MYLIKSIYSKKGNDWTRFGLIHPLFSIPSIGIPDDIEHLFPAALWTYHSGIDIILNNFPWKCSFKFLIVHWSWIQWDQILIQFNLFYYPSKLCNYWRSVFLFRPRVGYMNITISRNNKFTKPDSWLKPCENIKPCIPGERA